jgi:hypothetical protein
VVHYVYGVLPASVKLDELPGGVDDVPVTVEREGSIAALVSALADPEYAAESIERASADVEWVSARAMAHDRVLTAVSDRSPVVPFPMFSSMFSSLDGVRGMLRDRSQALESTIERVRAGREYALRVYRVDAELRGALSELSPEMRQLAAAAAAATPGQRYLLERKLDERSRDEIRAVAQRVVSEIVGALTAHSIESARSPIPPTTAGNAPSPSGTMVLNAAFLVSSPTLPAFQRRLTDFVAQYGSRGFRFDFTGPWPPYHFVSALDAR